MPYSTRPQPCERRHGNSGGIVVYAGDDEVNIMKLTEEEIAEILEAQTKVLEIKVKEKEEYNEFVQMLARNIRAGLIREKAADGIEAFLQEQLKKRMLDEFKQMLNDTD